MEEISLSGSGEGSGKATTRGYSTRSDSSEEFRVLTAPTMHRAAYSGIELHTGRPYRPPRGPSIRADLARPLTPRSGSLGSN